MGRKASLSLLSALLEKKNADNVEQEQEQEQDPVVWNYFSTDLFVFLE